MIYHGCGVICNPCMDSKAARGVSVGHRTLLGRFNYL